MIVCCDGMMRSGSAYQYNLVCSLLERVGTCVRHGRFEEEGLWLTSPVLQWALGPAYHVVKSGRYPLEFQMARGGLAKILYIHRDLRDVAVAAKYKWRMEGERLVQQMDLALSGYEGLERVGAFGQPWFLCQKYEEVFADPHRAVRDIAAFLGVAPSDAIVEDVVAACSMEKMYPISRSLGLHFNRSALYWLGRCAAGIKRFLPPPYNKSLGLRRVYLKLFPKVESHTLIAPSHIEPSKGVPGAWREHLNSHEQDILTTRYREYLRACGYSTDLRQETI